MKRQVNLSHWSKKGDLLNLYDLVRFSKPGDTLMKNKPYIYTLVLQEEKIKELTKRNKQLERGYLSVTRVNDRLRRQIARLKRRENELDNVNI